MCDSNVKKMTKGEKRKQTSLSYSTCICVSAKCTNAHTEVAASIYEVAKFREGWVASPTMISPKQKVFIVSSGT